MSGHSKWSTIKRQKGAADAKRSMTFTKLGSLITVAAREGGGDAESNFKLRLAIEKARQANMPKDNIERAIKRGTGELGGAAYEHIIYEAYAPGGGALVIDVNTDNRNRAVANIKALLNKSNGKLAESGAVSYLFTPHGVMTLSGAEKEKLEELIIDSGASDYEETETGYTVYTDPKETMQVAKTLQEQGVTVADIEVTMEPLSPVLISDAQAAKSLLNLIDQIEELDDVTAVYTNVEFAPELTLV